MNKQFRGIDLAQELSNGSSIKDIAGEVGCTEASVRRAANQRGIAFNSRDKNTSAREAIGDLKPMDAVEYLLALIEDVMPIFADNSHPVDGWGIHFTPHERILLGCLHDAAPRMVTKDAAFSALYAFHDSESVPEIKIIDIFICKIRKKIPAERGRIRTHWGSGYSFEVAV